MQQVKKWKKTGVDRWPWIVDRWPLGGAADTTLAQDGGAAGLRPWTIGLNLQRLKLSTIWRRAPPSQRRGTLYYQFSTRNYSLFTLHYSLSTLHYQLSTIPSPPPAILSHLPQKPLPLPLHFLGDGTTGHDHQNTRRNPARGSFCPLRHGYQPLPKAFFY